MYDRPALGLGVAQRAKDSRLVEQRSSVVGLLKARKQGLRAFLNTDTRREAWAELQGTGRER